MRCLSCSLADEIVVGSPHLGSIAPAETTMRDGPDVHVARGRGAGGSPQQQMLQGKLVGGKCQRGVELL